MATQLPSRVFSTRTLMDGMDMVNDMVGVEPLDTDDAALQAELEAMEVSCGVGKNWYTLGTTWCIIPEHQL